MCHYSLMLRTMYPFSLQKRLVIYSYDYVISSNVYGSLKYHLNVVFPVDKTGHSFHDLMSSYLIHLMAIKNNLAIIEHLLQTGRKGARLVRNIYVNSNYFSLDCLYLGINVCLVLYIDIVHIIPFKNNVEI